MSFAKAPLWRPGRNSKVPGISPASSDLVRSETGPSAEFEKHGAAAVNLELRAQQILYRECDGEANQDLLREGFVLVARLRDEDKGTRPSDASYDSPADSLESFLLSELAREKFEASMKYVRGMADKLHRTMSFLSIAESLRNSGMN
jgi:hypothetical protein